MTSVDLRDVEVLETAPANDDGRRLVGRWPCPFCDKQRELAEARAVRVRNRDGGSLERWVLMCDDCLQDI